MRWLNKFIPRKTKCFFGIHYWTLVKFNGIIFPSPDNYLRCKYCYKVKTIPCNEEDYWKNKKYGDSYNDLAK